jgi:hypothetical protein
MTYCDLSAKVPLTGESPYELGEIPVLHCYPPDMVQSIRKTLIMKYCPN